MKTVSEGLLNEFYRENQFVVDIIEFDLISGAVYLNNGPYDLSIDTPSTSGGAHTYTAQGEFLGFSTIQEDFDVKVGKLSIYLSGLTTLTNQFTDPRVSGRRVVIYRCFLNLTTGALVETPVMLFDGQIQNVSIVEGRKTCSMTIDCSSLFADFERSAGRKTNNDSNWFYQGFKYDTTMEKSGIIQNMELKWGRTQ